MKRIFGLVAILIFVGTAHGQTTTGFPQYGSFQSFGFGSVNLQNLNFNFTVPLVTSPGRGMNLSFGISYNSSMWSSGTSWTPAVNSSGQPTWGWNLTSPIGAIPYTHSTGTCDYIQGEHVTPYTTYLYNNYAYVEPNGTVHSFPTKYVIVPSPCTGHGTYITGSQFATDGSGYFINISSPSAPVVFSPSGLKITSSSVTDTNGNSITATVVNSSETDWTDSSGRVALKVISSSSSIQYDALTPTGTYATTTLYLSSQSIKTDFGCSGITEYTGTVSLPYSISFANGTTYSFAYETSGSSTVTGRLAYITLSGGGSYHLQYSGGANDGINCSDGSGNYVLVTPGGGAPTGNWTFARAQSSGNWQTTFTMPDYYTSVAQDQAVYTFNPAGQELSHLVYEGNVSGGTLMRQINTVWGSTGSPQSSTIVLEDGNTAVETDTTFDAYGNLTTLVEHNWGTVSAAGPVLRTTNLSYIYSGSSGSTYLAANILNRVLTKTVLDQNSVVQYSESIGYDSSGSLNAPCITGALQHNDTNYSCSFTTRGLATSDTVYANAAAQSGGETKNSTYDSLGNLRTAQLDCCQQKQWNYSATTQYTFPDSVVRGSGTPSLTTSYTYNAYTGQVVTSTDENGRQTSYTHDAYGRPLTITRPDNTVISYSYNDASQISSVSVPISGSSARKQQTTADTLGRPITVTLMDAAGNTYATISTIYDNFNRVLSSTNPNSGGTQYYTKKQYDVLGRLTTLTTPDGAVASYAYSTNTVTVTDPAGKSRKTAVDGVGRVTTAFEPDPTNNNLLTQQTSYTYTVLDALAGVSQGVQTRTFTYDGIGRLTNSSTPEAGAVAYQYNNFDLATQRTDARGVVTNYYYDALNRVAGLAYTLPQGSNVSPMPTSCTTPGGQAANVCYFYDQGGTTANALGRLTEIMDPTGSQTPTYDILGRMTQINKVTSGTTYTTSYAYNLSNELTSITYPSGRVVEQSVDAIGRICEVAPQTAGCGTAASPYATAFAYNAASEVTGFNYGNGVTAAFTYSPDRLQLTGLSYTKGTQTLFGLNYWYKLDSTNCPTGQTSNNGQIQCITDLVDTGRNVSYTYDPTERLATALTKGSTSSPQWGLSWTYDRYGNRTAQTPTAGSAPMNSLSFANPGGAQTNHADNFSYDASGNMTNDGENMLVYDAENRVTSNSTDSWACSYDGNGLRVKKVVGSTTTVYIFSGTKVIAEYVNGAAPSSPSTEYVYAGGSKLAKIQSGAITYYHQDHLSNRLVTNSTGGVAEQLGTYPFGESSYNTTNEKWLFTTYERDAESGNDYAMARTYINRFGRFSSSDRMSGSVADPQSLNHYGYVENDPINAADPSGMMMINMAQYILGFAGADINCELDGTDASCSFVSMLVGTGAAGQLPAGMNSAGFLDGNAYFISYTSDGETSDFDVSYPQLTAAEAEILGLPSELNPADGNFGGRGYSPEALKAALRKILKNPKCAALLGGTNKANQAVDHFLGQINVDAPGYSGNTQAKADIDSGAAWAETPVPDTGNFQGGQWTGPNFSTYIGNTVAGFTLSQQLTVQMHELIHATSSGSVIARGLVDLSNPFGQLANVYQIHKDCGTALPPNY